MPRIENAHLIKFALNHVLNLMKDMINTVAAYIDLGEEMVLEEVKKILSIYPNFKQVGRIMGLSLQHSMHF